MATETKNTMTKARMFEIAANYAATAAYLKWCEDRNSDDKGTCNFDETILMLKGSGLNRKIVIESLEKYGFRVFDEGQMRFSVTCEYAGRYQGWVRTVLAKCVTDAFCKMGYQAYTHYIMD